MLQDAGLPRERREHIRELTDQMLQLPLLGSRGGKGCELVSSPDPPLQKADVIELLSSSPSWLTHTVCNRPNLLRHRVVLGGQELASSVGDSRSWAARL